MGTLDFSTFERPQIATLVDGVDLKLTIKTQDNVLVGNITLEEYFSNDASKVGKIKAKIDGVVTTLNFQVGNGSSDILTGRAVIILILVQVDSGNDVITGRSGNNTLNSGDGDDIIWDGADVNVMHGNAGNDTILDDDGANTIQ